MSNGTKVKTPSEIKPPLKRLYFMKSCQTKVGNCHKALQNVAAIEMEPFGDSLWVVDSGTSAIFSRRNTKCPGKLVKINLKNKKFEVVHVFSREIISKNSLIMHLVVGNNRFYMTDTIQGRFY